MTTSEHRGRDLRIFFDVISPYAYLGWSRVHAVAARHGRHVVPVPVLFAALLDAHGQKGPAEIAPKRIYTFKHVVRIAADHGIVLLPPKSHPFNPLLGLRIAALPMSDEERRRTIDAVFAAVWAGGPGVEDPVALAAWLGARGLDGPALVAAAQTSDAKDRVRHSTADALAAGTFGVPTFEVDGELFWGQDALDHVERFLRGEDPVTNDVLAGWVGITASAVRPGSQK
jgi:2-hydroxychromene-2-carboxylate isomerase